MSSIFELPERVQRLRQMFSYFRNAALLTGADVRDAVQARHGAKAYDEWLALLADIRECFSAAEALTVGQGDPSAAAALGEQRKGDPPRELRLAETVH